MEYKIRKDIQEHTSETVSMFNINSPGFCQITSHLFSPNTYRKVIRHNSYILRGLCKTP